MGMMTAIGLAVLLALAAGPLNAAEPEGVDAGRPPAPFTVRPESSRLSRQLRKALRHIREELSATASGRRLLAVTEEVPIIERVHQPGPPVRYVGGETPVIVVDRDRAESLDSLAFETLFVLARTKAAAAPPVELRDMEMAAHQAVLQYALEKAALRRDFARRLRNATRRAEALLSQRRVVRDRSGDLRGGPNLLFPGRRPKGALERLAFDLYLFSEDPYLFYSVATDDSNLSPEAVTLTELEDYIREHGGRLDRVAYRALGRYALLEGRLYPGRVARAARIVGDREGLARIRERLGLFQTVARKELLRRVNQWMRESRK